MGAVKLDPTSVVLAGIIEPTLGAADADGNYFANSGRCFIHVKNGATVGEEEEKKRTVTIASQTPCRYGGTHDVSLEIAGDGVEMLIGPFPKNRFNDTDGNVQVTYSDDAADVTIAVIKVP